MKLSRKRTFHHFIPNLIKIKESKLLLTVSLDIHKYPEQLNPEVLGELVKPCTSITYKHKETAIGTPVHAKLLMGRLETSQVEKCLEHFRLYICVQNGSKF